MEQFIIPGIPAEYAVIVYTLVAFLSSQIVLALTALGKKWGQTTGRMTMFVSFVLSMAVSVAFNLWSTRTTGQPGNAWAVLGLGVFAFLKANGDYLAKAYSTGKGVEAAQPVPAVTEGDILPPADLIQPPRGLEGS